MNSKSEEFAIWDEDLNSNLPFNARVLNLEELKDFNFVKTNSFDRAPPRPLLYLEANEISIDYITVGLMYFGSEALLNVFDKFSVNFEAYATEVVNESTTLSESYYCFHLLEEIDCINRELSKFKYVRDFVTEIDVLEVDRDLLKDKHLIKTANSAPPILICSSAIEEEISGQGLKGVEFLSCEEWPNKFKK